MGSIAVEPVVNIATIIAVSYISTRLHKVCETILNRVSNDVSNKYVVCNIVHNRVGSI